jgi:MFS family permease
LLLAFLLGPLLFTGLAGTLDTKRSIFLALVAYTVIAIWGYFLDSVIEFWFLAWMVAVVQGGSQALSRSLYASMSPASKSGEFFGFFSVMEKASSFSGPLLFALAVALFGSSRPGVLSLILFFIIGGFLLTRVNVEEGRRRWRAPRTRRQSPQTRSHHPSASGAPACAGCGGAWLPGGAQLRRGWVSWGGASSVDAMRAPVAPGSGRWLPGD